MGSFIMSPKMVGCAFLFSCLPIPNGVASYKILILPSTPVGSHYLYVAKIGEHLSNAGHKVTLLMGDFNDLHKTPGYEKFFEVRMYNTLLGDSFKEQVKSHFICKSLRGRNSFQDFKIIANALLRECELLLESEALLDSLKNAHFDIIVLDNFAPCNTLIAEKLSLPFVVVSPNRPLPQRDAYAMAIPTPSSFVPATFSTLTDKMTFMERVLNLGLNIFNFYIYHFINLQPYNDLKVKYDIKPDVGISESMGRAEIILFGVDWSLEFPLPMMPNAVFIGGLLAGEASPLNDELEKFMNSAEEGIVIFSLGSFTNLGYVMETAEMIAAALARLPQKVIMRYEGEEPKCLGNNTKLADWIPQNDLLGHPRTKAFVTHGGLNGIYQAIFHGVPMVAVPLFGDQFSNGVRLSSKGIGVALNMRTLTSDELYQTIKTVIDEPSYKQNAVRLSKIHRDRPMSPGDSAVFWIEHVIKYGGQHLRAEAFNLNFIQYFMLDVVVFMLIIVLLMIVLTRKLMSFLYMLYCKQTQKVKII